MGRTFPVRRQDRLGRNMDPTPWTIPANLAIALHPDFTYAAVDVGEERFISCRGPAQECHGKMRRQGLPGPGKVSGKKIGGVQMRHPFLDRDSLILLAPYVTLDAGTEMRSPQPPVTESGRL